MFFVLVLGFTLNFLFYLLYGCSFIIVCQIYIRWILVNILQVCVDATIIFSIINLHFSTLAGQAETLVPEITV